MPTREQPRTVKELLVNAKDVAELMVDLAYAAVFFADPRLGREVVALEEQLTEIIQHLRRTCMLAARTVHDAEGLSGVLALASNMEDIGDAAEDIARVVLKDVGVPAELRADLAEAHEVTTRVTIHAESSLAGKRFEELMLPTTTGFWVLALRRDVGWVFDVGRDTVLAEGDRVILQGPPDRIDELRALAGMAPRDGSTGHNKPAGGTLSNLDRAVDLVVELKNNAEVAVGLAYSSILMNDRMLASEVGVIEQRSDSLWHDLEGWVLKAATEAADTDQLRGLLHVAHASERIVDSARSMTKLVEWEGDIHPIVAVALADADEPVMEAVVHEGAALLGITIGQIKAEVAPGIDVLAIERDGTWIYRPRAKRDLRVGDRLLAIGPEESAPLLRAACADPREADEDGSWVEQRDDDELADA